MISGLIIIGLFLGLLLGRVLIHAAVVLARTNKVRFDEVIIRRLRSPVYIFLPLFCGYAAVKSVRAEALDQPLMTGVAKVLAVIFISWLLMRIVHIASDIIKKRYDTSVKDNLNARRVHTQIMVVRRIANFMIFILAIGAIFLLFEQLRGLGVSLLASAGVAGIIIGLAAQKALGNLLAGIQIAITQPIRLEDAVVVEGEWGWIEEITLTYVVVRIWDWRRMVLPISYFIENPFQNWTRNSANIIGAVVLYTDYTMPLAPIRDELERLLNGHELWDGNVQVVQMVDCEENVAKIRILVSAADSPTAWDLRCFIREQIVAFIKENYPESLPKTRAVLEDMPISKSK